MAQHGNASRQQIGVAHDFLAGGSGRHVSGPLNDVGHAKSALVERVLPASQQTHNLVASRGDPRGTRDIMTPPLSLVTIATVLSASFKRSSVLITSPIPWSS